MIRQTRCELAWLPFDRNGLGAELYAFGLQLVASSRKFSMRPFWTTATTSLAR